MKVKVSVAISKEIYQEAHNLGLNVSKVSENALKACIEAIKQRKPFLTPSSFGKEMGADRVGFEPTTSSLEDWHGSGEDWNAFRFFLESKHYRGGYERTLYNYAQQYSQCLFNEDLSKVRDIRGSLRPNILKALAILAKFTGRYETWLLLLKKFDLRWSGRSKDDIFIDRLNNVKDVDEIWNWVKDVKAAKPGLTSLLNLMSVSGLRFVEGINSVNLLVAGTQGYYNLDNEALEHWRFKEIFIRNTKKAFVSFVPHERIESLRLGVKLPEPNQIQSIVHKTKLGLRFGDIREAHGTFLTKYLKAPEIDFLHGRVTSSVFMANYFNPALIVDLKARVFQGIKEIEGKIQ